MASVRLRRHSWWAALAAGSACLTLTAPAEELALDRAHSRVGFSIPVLWWFERHGDFEDLSLTVDIDENAGRVRIDARIGVASARMDDPADVATLKSADYFDALNHPEIRFRAPEVPLEVLGSGGELVGELTLRGITRPVRFQLAPDPCTPTATLRYCPFEVLGRIRRHDFGMSARRGILGDEVTVSIRLVPETASASATEPPLPEPPAP